MNTPALAAEIVTKIRNSMQDSPHNQAIVVEHLILEAVQAEVHRKLKVFETRYNIAIAQEMGWRPRSN